MKLSKNAAYYDSNTIELLLQKFEICIKGLCHTFVVACIGVFSSCMKDVILQGIVYVS